MLRSNINLAKGPMMMYCYIIEIMWPYYRRTQLVRRLYTFGLDIFLNSPNQLNLCQL